MQRHIVLTDPAAGQARQAEISRIEEQLAAAKKAAQLANYVEVSADYILLMQSYKRHAPGSRRVQELGERPFNCGVCEFFKVPGSEERRKNWHHGQLHYASVHLVTIQSELCQICPCISSTAYDAKNHAKFHEEPKELPKNVLQCPSCGPRWFGGAAHFGRNHLNVHEPEYVQARELAVQIFQLPNPKLTVAERIVAIEAELRRRYPDFKGSSFGPLDAREFVDEDIESFDPATTPLPDPEPEEEEEEGPAAAGGGLAPA